MWGFGKGVIFGMWGLGFWDVVEVVTVAFDIR